ncbi:MAG TPA: hypothetical protein VK922_10245 [Gemmatimonadaceae bacterium]|nr:hypothetical protein [Gemmatimonadaceae bacterium]
MTNAPPRAFGRAPRFAAAAIAAVLLAGLGAGHLTTDSAPRLASAQPQPAAPAHVAAAPPQSLAITADFFEAMGFDARDTAEEPATPAPAPPAACSAEPAQGLASRRRAGVDSATAARVAAEAAADSAVLTTARVPPMPDAPVGAAPSRSE